MAEALRLTILSVYIVLIYYLDFISIESSNFFLNVRMFQKVTNLQVSGKLDLATLAMMNKPRCGLEDSFDNKSLKYRVLGR